MPTGVLSLGTIAQRLRAAADSSTLSTVDIENLAACAETLEAGHPSTKQLRAIASVVSSIAEYVNTPEFWRCVSALDYWATHPSKPPKAPSKPDWMVHNEEMAAYVEHALDVAPPANGSAWAIAGAIQVVLDEIVSGDYVDETWLDLEALIRTLKRLA